MELTFEWDEDKNIRNIQNRGISKPIYGLLVAGKPPRRGKDNMSDSKIKSQQALEEEMQPEYDFTGGVRGKHQRAYQQGHRVIIHKMDGTTEIQEFPLADGVVLLDPDVRTYFPDAASVNRALRGLIHLIPKQQAVSETDA